MFVFARKIIAANTAYKRSSLENGVNSFYLDVLYDINVNKMGIMEFYKNCC